jgi:hypothetical protein
MNPGPTSQSPEKTRSLAIASRVPASSPCESSSPEKCGEVDCLKVMDAKLFRPKGDFNSWRRASRTSIKDWSHSVWHDLRRPDNDRISHDGVYPAHANSTFKPGRQYWFSCPGATSPIRVSRQRKEEAWSFIYAFAGSLSASKSCDIR